MVGDAGGTAARQSLRLAATPQARYPVSSELRGKCAMAGTDYQLDILVQGHPGKAVCHGGLGWSTIVLLRGHGRVALIDTGSFGQRQLILDRLAANGLAPNDVTDVLLTHSHWDHSVNWVMFPKAKIYIGGSELAWAVKEPWGVTPVPELYVRELESSPQTVRH